MHPFYGHFSDDGQWWHGIEVHVLVAFVCIYIQRSAVLRVIYEPVIVHP